MLVCAMFVGMASTSCEKDPVKNDQTENPGNNGDENGGGNGGGNNTDALVLKYTGNENMNGQYVNIGQWSATIKAESNWTATGYGQFNADNEAEFDVALLKANDKIWVCVEKVVKYFHTVTAAEIEAGVINLPDKDGGCTLLPEPTLGGKPYVNDWVVALYMGVDAWSSRPLYWATGNLIAVKTGEANAPSEPAFYLATLEETAQEALGGNSGNPYNAATEAASQEQISATDGFKVVAKGYRWDCFMPLDGTGTRTDFVDAGVYDNHTQNAMDYVKNTLGEANWSFGGYDGYDIAATQLGGAWSIPDRFDAACPGTPIVQATSATMGKLCEFIYKADRTSGVWDDGNKKYWKVVYQTEGGFENTILLPAGAMRRNRGGKLTSDPAQRVVIMASCNVPGQPNTMCFDTYAEGVDAGYGYNNQYQKLFNVRPVTE